MIRSIPQRLTKIKNFPSSSTNGRDHSFKPFRRPYLPLPEFKEANKQKLIWLNAVIQECGLSGNEIIVLEALLFLTDSFYGHGVPSIGAIQEACLRKTSSIHRRTVQNCLKRLQQKGAIVSTFRGVKKTNEFRLIGFEYKLESCCERSVHNINSSSLPKGKGGRKSNLNTKVECDMQFEVKEYVPPPKDFVKEQMEIMKRSIYAS